MRKVDEHLRERPVEEEKTVWGFEAMARFCYSEVGFKKNLGGCLVPFFVNFVKEEGEAGVEFILVAGLGFFSQILSNKEGGCRGVRAGWVGVLSNNTKFIHETTLTNASSKN